METEIRGLDLENELTCSVSTPPQPSLALPRNRSQRIQDLTTPCDAHVCATRPSPRGLVLTFNIVLTTFAPP